jgi:DNA-binding response OmpR family regulator
VLIVDDNLELAENIAEILTFEGYLTEVSGSAEEALPNALRAEVGIVVTDYRLPGMTGADFIKRLRQHRKHLHAVVISAYTDERTVSAAREVGARFLSKPVDFALLSSFVRDL